MVRCCSLDELLAPQLTELGLGFPSTFEVSIMVYADLSTAFLLLTKKEISEMSLGSLAHAIKHIFWGKLIESVASRSTHAIGHEVHLIYSHNAGFLIFHNVYLIKEKHRTFVFPYSILMKSHKTPSISYKNHPRFPTTLA